jgi:hypothetical protein
MEATQRVEQGNVYAGSARCAPLSAQKVSFKNGMH